MHCNHRIKPTLKGLTFELEFTSRGTQLTIGGFNDKAAPFASKIINALKQYVPTADTYNRYKDLLERDLNGWKTQQPYAHCSYFASLATETLQFRNEDLLAAVKRAKKTDLDNFLNRLLKRSYCTALVMGNVDEEGAKDLVGIVEDAFPFAPLPEEERSRRLALELPLSPSSSSSPASGSPLAPSPLPEAAVGYKLARPEPNTQDENSAVTFYFQLPTRDAKETILLELLSEAIEQAFYNSLRTQQQLGYIVFSGIRNKEGIYSLVFTVQSSVLDGPGLSQCIETFLEKEALPLLTSLSAQDFESYRQGIRVGKLEPDQRLTSQASRFWSEVSMNLVYEPQFDRSMREVKLLDAVDQRDFTQFVKDFLSPMGSKRRLLVSQVTSQIATAPSAKSKSKGEGEGGSFVPIDNEDAFRSTLKTL